MPFFFSCQIYLTTQKWESPDVSGDYRFRVSGCILSLYIPNVGVWQVLVKLDENKEEMDKKQLQIFRE